MLKRFTGLFYTNYDKFLGEYSPKDARAKHLLEISPYKKRVIQEIKIIPEAFWEIIECSRNYQPYSDYYQPYSYNERNEILWIDLLMKCNTISSDDLSGIPHLDWKRLGKKMVFSDRVLREYHDEIDWDQVSKSEIHRKDVEFIKHFGDHLEWSRIGGLDIDLDKEWISLVYRDRMFSVLGYALEKRFLKRIDLQNNLEYIAKNHLDRLINNYDPRDYYDLKTDNFGNDDFFDKLEGKSKLLAKNLKSHANWPKELLPILVNCPELMQVESSQEWTTRDQHPELISRSHWHESAMHGMEWDLEYYKSHILPTAPPEFWSWISGDRIHVLPDDFVEEYFDRLDWNLLIKKQQLNRKLLEQVIAAENKVPLKELCLYQDLPEHFIDQSLQNATLSKRDLDRIAIKSKLSEKFMHENRDKLDWFLLSQYQRLSPSFIEKHVDYVNWGQVSEYQDLTPEFVETYGKRLNEIKLGMNRHLTEKKIIQS